MLIEQNKDRLRYSGTHKKEKAPETFPEPEPENENDLTGGANKIRPKAFNDDLIDVQRKAETSSLMADEPQVKKSDTPNRSKRDLYK